jgi:serine/threonine-protein kinase
VIGQKINNYEIVAQIGEGGMGAVYMARHPFLDRKVAIKVLRPSLASDQTLVNRFFNEARAATAIRHANIIEVSDVGLLPGSNTPYLMMEYLEGENISRRLKRMGRIRVGDAVEFAFQTAAALTAAHAKGIIHRDLKPENLYLVPDPGVPGREIVKVLDFGIAKLRGDLGSGTGGNSVGGEVKTQTGQIMGTPPYMSPEQCRGVSAQIDHRTDIYSLGIILFEMLCGAPPFTGDGFGDILVAHLTQEPPSPRAINGGIPEHLERTILKALAKKPADRFASMAELQTALGSGPARTEAYVTAARLEAPASTQLAPIPTPGPQREAVAGGSTPEGALEGQASPSSPGRAPAAFESVAGATGLAGGAAAGPSATTTFSKSAGQILAVGDGEPGDELGHTDLVRPARRRGLVAGILVAAAAGGVAIAVGLRRSGEVERARRSAGPGARPSTGGPALAPGTGPGPARPGSSASSPKDPAAPAPAPPASAALPAPAAARGAGSGATAGLPVSKAKGEAEKAQSASKGPEKDPANAARSERPSRRGEGRPKIGAPGTPAAEPYRPPKL